MARALIDDVLLFLLPFGVFAAWLLVRQRFAGRGALEFATMLSFAVPGTVIGVLILGVLTSGFTFLGINVFYIAIVNTLFTTHLFIYVFSKRVN